MKIDSLKTLCVEELKDLYHAEQQLSKAMPRMIDAATASDLKKALREHHDETQGQIDRLNTVFEKLGARPEARKCRAMEGLIAEMDELLGEDMEPQVRDAAILASAQRIEHYEMAGYGATRTHCTMLGEKEAASQLQATLDEEGEANKTLKRIAEEHVNSEALSV